MAYNFPDTPALNDTATNASTGIAYEWDGTKWVIYGGPAGGAGGLPEAPMDGQVYGRDGKAGAWDPVLPLAGGTMTGLLVLSADPTALLGAATKQYVDAVAPDPSPAVPLMDGTAEVGSAAPDAREDHVHPSDTSRVAKAGDTMTGLLVLSADPTAALGAATKQYVDAVAPDPSTVLPLMDGTA